MSIKTTPGIVSAIIFILAACTAERPHDAVDAGRQPSIYPDYIGVTIPAEIAPMNFNVTDDSISAVYVKVTGGKGGEMEASGEWADFDIDEWHSLTEANRGSSLTFSVSVKDAGGQWKRYDDFTMNVSKHPLADYGLTYRKIAPGYQTFSKIGIYQRRLDDFCEEPVLEASAVGGQCVNCHSANATDPGQLSLHVRGPKGGTLIQRGGERVWLETKTDSTISACAHPYWHPSGDFCAYALSPVYQLFYQDQGNGHLIEPYDKASDIVVLDVNTLELLHTPLLLNDDFQTYPAFSPDGKTLFYCSAAGKQMPDSCLSLRYNLCSIGFDAGRKAFAEQADTIFCAERIGKSATFPRPSYDGRYLMFSVADSGIMPVYHKEGDLWIMDLSDMQARPLDEVNSDDAESFHSWSSSSRWFVFGSRRGDSLYSRLYIAMMGDDGRCTKPFLLPQRNPKEYYHSSLFSYNTPDFTKDKVSLDAISAGSELLYSHDKIRQVTYRQGD